MKIPETRNIPFDDVSIKDQAVSVYLKKLVIEHKRIYEEIARVINYNVSYLLPRRLRQTAQPTPNTDELIIWSDDVNNKVYLIVNDTDEGVKKVELT